MLAGQRHGTAYPVDVLSARVGVDVVAHPDHRDAFGRGHHVRHHDCLAVVARKPHRVERGTEDIHARDAQARHDFAGVEPLVRRDHQVVGPDVARVAERERNGQWRAAIPAKAVDEGGRCSRHAAQPITAPPGGSLTDCSRIRCPGRSRGVFAGR